MSNNSTSILNSWKLTNRHLIGTTVTLIIGAAILFAFVSGRLSLSSFSSAIQPSASPPQSASAQSTDARITDGSSTNSGDSVEFVRPMPVMVQRLEHVSSINQTRTYTGIIKPGQQSEIGFELAGRIIAVHVDEGDEVTTGMPLAVLDTTALVARRTALEADLARANSVLDELKAGPRLETISAARADVRSAEAGLQLARLNLERSQRLIDSSSISQSEHDLALFEHKSAISILESENQRLLELESGTRPEQIAAQSFVVDSLSASIAEVEVSIDKSRIQAPFDGVVTRRFIDNGSIVAPATPVFRIVDHRNLEAWIGLPVNIAGSTDIGSEHTITVGEETIIGTCQARISELDPVTRTRTVIFRLNMQENEAANNLAGNEDNLNPTATTTILETPQIVSGQLCEIEIASRITASGFRIPNTALTSSVRGLWTVYVARQIDSVWRAVRCDVEVIRTDVDSTLCRGTLTDGDLLIVEGLHKITAGQQITFEQ